MNQWLLKIEKLSYHMFRIFCPSYIVVRAMWCQFHIYLFIESRLPLNRIWNILGSYFTLYVVHCISFERGWDWDLKTDVNKFTLKHQILSFLFMDYWNCLRNSIQSPFNQFQTSLKIPLVFLLLQNPSDK